MRRFALLLLVAAAAAGEGDLEREIEAFVAGIKQEGASGALAPFSSRVDPDALVAEMASQGLPADGLKETLTRYPELLARMDSQLPIETLRLRKVQATADGAIAVIDFRGEDYTSRVRLFLVRKDDAWRICDFDVPDIAIRMSTFLGMGMQAIRGGQAETSAAMANLTQAIVACQREDFARARELLETRGGELPEKFEAVRLIFLATALLGTSEHEEALKACEEAEKKSADMPILAYLRAMCLRDLDRPEEALTAARRYVETLGETADICELMGGALASLGRDDDAAAAYRAGLREHPAYTGNLLGLLVVRPAEKTEEIAQHLRRTGDASGAFIGVGWDLAEAEEWEALRALVAAHRTVQPEDLWIDYYAAVLLRAEDKPLEALSRVGGALAKVQGDDRSYFIDLHAELAAGCGKTIDAYDAAPESFAPLASRLSDAADAKGLSALVARRAEAGRPDAALHLWTIEVAWLEGRHEDVVGLATIHADAIREELAAGTWPLDNRWIRSLVKLGREEDGLRQARRVADAGEGHYYVLLVRVAFGRAAEAIREFERCVEEGSEPSDLYADEDLSALAKGEAYAPLRARYPLPEDDE